MLTTLQYEELDGLIDQLQHDIAYQLRRVQRFGAAYGETTETIRIECVLQAVLHVLGRQDHDDNDDD